MGCGGRNVPFCPHLPSFVPICPRSGPQEGDKLGNAPFRIHPHLALLNNSETDSEVEV